MISDNLNEKLNSVVLSRNINRNRIKDILTKI